MIGKRWKKFSHRSLMFFVATFLSVVIGTWMLCVGLTNETTLVINTNVSLGFVLFIFAVGFSLCIAITGEDQAKGKSLTENDLVENEIYEVVGQLITSNDHEGKAVFRAFLVDRDGYIGAFRLPCSVPPRFKVVEDKDGNWQYKLYPEPESQEPQPGER